MTEWLHIPRRQFADLVRHECAAYRAQLERREILWALGEPANSQIHAARLLTIPPPTLCQKMKELGIPANRPGPIRKEDA